MKIDKNFCWKNFSFFDYEKQFNASFRVLLKLNYNQTKRLDKNKLR